MGEAFAWVKNTRTSRDWEAAEAYGKELAGKVQRYHQSFPGYERTRLCRMAALSEVLGVGELFVKDESSRFGLNAFKSLGGSYAMGRVLAERAGLSEGELSYASLVSEGVQKRTEGMTFVTATDGNHGRGVAWAARELGKRAVVYLPKGSALERLDNIRRLGAEAEITEFYYDDTVRLAARREKEKGWVLVQDTSWEGYEKVPRWIMQGYMTMALEAVQQLGETVPTHVFLQAGVGSMAGALAAFFADYYRERKPVIVIVEPNAADCLYRTAKAGDGGLHFVSGEMNSIMAGLCCGEPCGLAWEMLRRYAEFFVSMPDYVAANGMRILGNPAGSDPRIISGESGASTLGCLAGLMRSSDLGKARADMGLGRNSAVLCISTEGDTDRENYRRIVWDGAYPKKND